MKLEIPVEELHKRFRYCPETGVLYRRRLGAIFFETPRAMNIYNTRYAGKPCEFVNKDGYLEVGIGRCKYLVHRLIYAMVSGSWPKGIVDHEDTDRQNNRFDNLRDTTHSVNNRNRKRRKVKPTSSGKYEARPVYGGKTVQLGLFDTAEEAADAIEKWKQTADWENEPGKDVKPLQSGVTGVIWNKNRKKWTVTKRIDGKMVYFGTYKNLENAIDRRNEVWASLGK